MKYFLLATLTVAQLHGIPATARENPPPHSDDYYRRQAMHGCTTAAQRAAEAEAREAASNLLVIRLSGFNEPPPCETSTY